MRLLVVQESDWIDRNPILHHRMLESLALAGDQVTVLDHEILWHSRPRRPRWKRGHTYPAVHRFFPEASVTVVRPGMLRVPGLSRPSWLATTAVELRKQLAEQRPDVMIGYGISNAYLGQRAARHAGIPFVYHLMDALHTLAEPAVLSRLAGPVERVVMRHADEVIVVNNALAEYARGMGADPRSLHVVPMGVNPARAPAPPSPGFRASLGFGDDDLVLLFMGWLYTFSGLLELVDELRRLEDERPRIKLLVVGDGDLLPDLLRIRESGELEDRLVVTGRRPAQEMPQFLAAADVCLLPALRTKTMQHIVPAKVIEYMEAGKPVVATRLRGIEAEFGELPGLLYIDHPSESVACIEKALAGPQPRVRAAELGATCRSFMERRPDWEAVTEHFRSIVHGARPRHAF